MEKFIEGSQLELPNGELQITWHDGTKLVFAHQVAYSNWESFMILSDFTRTKEELVKMCELMGAEVSKNITDGNLNKDFSFDEARKKIHEMDIKALLA